LEALEQNATNRPSELTALSEEFPFPSSPALLTLTRSVMAAERHPPANSSRRIGAGIANQLRALIFDLRDHMRRSWQMR
jgi:hypothetical protein